MALQVLLLSLLLCFSLLSSIHAILHKRDPRSGVGWVVTCILLPVLGPCLYWLLGVNRIRTHAQKMVRLGFWRHATRTKREEWAFQLPKDHPFQGRDYQGILQVSEKVNRHPLMMGNKVQALFDGEEAYPAMLSAIERAEKFIYLCVYIFESDGIGKDFVEALISAKNRGVQVWVLVDAFGEHYGRRPVSNLLRSNGIQTARFLPLAFSLNSLHLNLRNHRKSLVVDGKVGFTGGMNIRQKHMRKASGEEGIADIHFQVEGPVVLELQELFLEDWYFSTGESLPWLATPHELLPGNKVCRVISGGPNEDFEKIHWILLGALAWAKKKVRIMTPYFVPDRVIISALNAAALRGVTIEVLLPEKNNLPFVGWASRALLWEMMEKGVRFFLQPAPFNHGKLFVVDDTYALIGSSNWDSRSLRLNFELDLEVYDPDFAAAMGEYFERNKALSRPLFLEEIRRDPWRIRLRDSFCRLFSPYL